MNNIRKHCNFDVERANVMRVPTAADTFPAKLNSSRSQKDAKNWNIKNDFTHVNMVPFQKDNRGYQNDNNWNSVLEYQTGNFIFKEFQKREIEPHFAPYVTHVPNINEDYNETRADNDFGLSERLNIHKYKQGERPAWTWTQVAPGINKGYTNCGSEGYHSFWRSPVPTYEERRNKTRPEFDFRNHVMYGRMENFDNATVEAMEWTREKNPTAWEDERDYIANPNGNNVVERQRAEINMNLARKMTPSDYYGDSYRPDGEQRRDADQHDPRQRGNGLNNIGAMNLDSVPQGQMYSQQELQSQLLRNLRRTNTGEELPLGSMDRAAGTIGALDYNISQYNKDEAIKKRNFLVLNSLRSGNVRREKTDNQYILPVGLAPDTNKHDIIAMLKRGGVIDTQANVGMYLDPEAPDPTIKQFFIDNWYTSQVDTQETNYQNHPDAPNATIKEYYASLPSQHSGIGTLGTDMYGVLADTHDNTKRQEYIRNSMDSSVATGYNAPNGTKIMKPLITRKDGVAMNEYVRSGGSGEGHVQYAKVQTNANRSIDITNHTGGARKSSKMPGRLDPQTSRHGQIAQQLDNTALTRQNIGTSHVTVLNRNMPQNTMSSRKESGVNSRFSY